ncbi:Flp family type IVb pilin [Sphingomonas sp.]|jgi:pilus assembly protein Flp/PilA|uniref:Flp family type IVb pilin n=1 Tax=Sphingomonas sp. TaxID=28214 RepID=UPI002ED9DEB4
MNARTRIVKSRRARSLRADTRAATAVEYGLILALMVLAIIGGVTTLAEATTGMWNNVNDKVTKAH